MKISLVSKLLPGGTQIISTGPGFPHVDKLHVVVTILHSLTRPSRACWYSSQLIFCKKSNGNRMKSNENRMKSEDFWKLLWKSEKHAKVNYIIRSQRVPDNTDPTLTLLNRENFLMVNFWYFLIFLQTIFHKNRMKIVKSNEKSWIFIMGSREKYKNLRTREHVKSSITKVFTGMSCSQSCRFAANVCRLLERNYYFFIRFHSVFIRFHSIFIRFWNSEKPEFECFRPKKTTVWPQTFKNPLRAFWGTAEFSKTVSSAFFHFLRKPSKKNYKRRKKSNEFLKIEWNWEKSNENFRISKFRFHSSDDPRRLWVHTAPGIQAWWDACTIEQPVQTIFHMDLGALSSRKLN